MRTTAFRLSLIYFGLFAAMAAAAVGYTYYRTSILLDGQLESAIETELSSLDQRYRKGGLHGLRAAIAERTETAGNSLYLLANTEGRHLAGNLKAVSEQLWNASGGVTFLYRRAYENKVEERLAFAVVLRFTNGFRLVVGRDIDDQRQFGEAVRRTFLWTLGGMVLFGLGAGVWIGRSLLKRIESITDTTQRIMAGDLSERIPLTGTDDEFDRLATSLNAMLQRIEELIAGFREVSDNIAHDLRTPLSRLRSRVEAALRETAPESHREALQATIEDADELINTFNALLSIARLEAGAQRTDQHFNLAAVVRDVAELYEPVAEERGIALLVEADGETVFDGQRELIAQALANILDNAIKYGAARGEPESGKAAAITVRLVQTGDVAQIVIADRGPGIHPEDRERVFKRFVRLEASRSQPGSGLGLSLAAAVARLHGGDLTLSDNEPGLAATLTIRRRNAAPLEAQAAE
jgi:signal transduction histidine kinase